MEINTKPYTDFKVPDYSVIIQETGRKNLNDMPIPEIPKKPVKIHLEELNEKVDNSVKTTNIFMTFGVIIMFLSLFVIIKIYNENPTNLV